jgi:pyruvate,water dikinase
LRLPTAAANAALAHALDAQATPETLTAFTARFGHRSGSLDYAAPTWGELAASGQLAAHYRAAAPPREAHRGPRRIQTARWRLSRILLWPLVRLLEMREEQRFAWERILAAQRGLLCAEAEGWVRQGWLDSVADLWFLTWDEVVGLARRNPAETRRIVARRRRAQRLERVMRRPLFIGPLSPAAAGPGGALLHGLPGASGSGAGRALHLAHPAQFDAERHAGRVLVLRALDPAWTPLLPKVAGLVIERGGLLSHAALLAREYGVPLVIGIEDACERIPEGAWIRVDGDAGAVALLPGAPEGAISPP